jgi:hypothetical protein
MKATTTKPLTIARDIGCHAYIERARHTKLGEEINHFLGVQEDNEDYSGKPDYVDAVFQTETFAEENGDRAAGLHPFTETVTVTVQSGDTGGEEGEFEMFLVNVLNQWYDGAGVGLVRKGESPCAAMAKALEPFAHFARQYARKPMKGVDDSFYGIHAGSEYEARLSHTDMKRAARALAKYQKQA